MNHHTQFVGSIPQKYDEHLGPLFFDFYAGDLARRVEAPPEGRVLEITCGTGITTEQLRSRLPHTVPILATDLNDAMLDHARDQRGSLPNVRFEQADAMELPFADGSFDAVVSQFGLMFLPDKVQGMREARRVLRPDGAFTFNVWASAARNPVAKLAHQTIAKFFPKDPPSFLTVPFGYHRPRQITADLTAAGFTRIALEAVTHQVERPAARHVAIGLVEGNPGIHEINERASAPAEQIIDAVAEALRQAYGDAPMRTSLEALVITARP